MWLPVVPLNYRLAGYCLAGGGLLNEVQTIGRSWSTFF